MTETSSADVRTREPIIVPPSERARGLNVVGEQVTILASVAQTGSYEIFHQSGPEGSGQPPHFHPWDEAFYVLSGEMAFGVADREMVAETGTLVHVPAGTTHWFRFGAGGGAMLSMTSREAASIFFSEADREVAADAPDIGKLLEVAQRNDISVPAPR